MARRVFFSFHYERDIIRVNQVRNSWVTQDREAAGFWDASLWEEAKKKGDSAIKKMILDGLDNTSVTVVLIGAESADRDYVQYEIIESHKRGNGLLGIYIHDLKNFQGRTDFQGANPFDRVWIQEAYNRKCLSSVYPIYYWTGQDGYRNFASWVEAAAKAAGR